jgi:hypothetical protein
MSQRLDARNYYWRTYEPAVNSVFAAFVQPATDVPRAVGEVRFDEATLDQLDYDTHGIRWSYYGAGRIEEYAAVLLDNGHVLFCVVSGRSFGGTFSPDDRIAMQYYDLTPRDTESV